MGRKLVCLGVGAFLAVLVLATNAPAGIVYVDATDGEGGNTTFAAGGTFTNVPDNSGTDNIWRERPGFANPTGAGTIYEAGGTYGETANPEDCPRLLTTVAVPANKYNVYAYIWSDGSPWRIRASLTDVIGDELPLFVAGGAPEGTPLPATAVAGDFDAPVPMLAEGNRTLWQVSLGATDLTTILKVYVDDDPVHMTQNQRTWYDGIGYSVVPEPATMALLGLGGLALLRRKHA